MSKTATDSDTDDTEAMLARWERGAGKQFVFHYTNQQALDALLAGEPFIVGHRAQHGFGLYATHLAPGERAALDEVAALAFKGDVPSHAVEPEIGCVVVLYREFGPDYTFVQVESDPYDWLIERPAGEGAKVHLDGLIAGAARWDGTGWQVIDVD